MLWSNFLVWCNKVYYNLKGLFCGLSCKLDKWDNNSLLCNNSNNLITYVKHAIFHIRHYANVRQTKLSYWYCIVYTVQTEDFGELISIQFPTQFSTPSWNFLSYKDSWIVVTNPSTPPLRPRCDFLKLNWQSRVLRQLVRWDNLKSRPLS